MDPWIYPVVGTIITAILGWIKYGGLAKLVGKIGLLVVEISQAIKATGDFLEKFAHYWEDKKLTPEEMEKLGAQASVLYSEWKQVIAVFGELLAIWKKK